MRKPRQSLFAFQSLESRTLFALNLHTAVPGGLPMGAFTHDDCPEVVAARDELRKDIVQMRADQRTGRELINADRKAVVDELAKAAEAVPDLEEQLQPLRQKFADDRRIGYREIRQDEAAIRTKMQEFAPTIRDDKKALRQATELGDQAAIDAAKAKLSADRAIVEEAVKPLQDELKSDQQKTKDLLAADRAAIDDKLAELDPALAPLLDKLEADGKALDEKMAAARAEIQGDVETLRTEIKACAEEHGESTTGLDGTEPIAPPPPRPEGGEGGTRPPPTGTQPPPPPPGDQQQPPPGDQQQPPPGGQQQPPPPPPGDGTQQPPPPRTGGGQQPPPPPPPPGDGTQQPPPGGDRLPPPPPPSETLV